VGFGVVRVSGLATIAFALAWFQPASATGLKRPTETAVTSAITPAPPELRSSRVHFGTGAPSSNAQRVADWVMATGDHTDQPFVIIDKINARVFAFDSRGNLLGAAPALLGLAQGDDNPPGIGDKPLAMITPAERITPSGRFVAALGHDLGKQDILWVDYASAISLHRVIPGKASDGRLQRLASASTLDNRISYGCINVPVDFYEGVIRPAFRATTGIVYVLPEHKSIHEVFSIPR
jgi:hypothetical protein